MPDALQHAACWPECPDPGPRNLDTARAADAAPFEGMGVRAHDLEGLNVDSATVHSSRRPELQELASELCLPGGEPAGPQRLEATEIGRVLHEPEQVTIQKSGS